MALVYSLDMH